MTTRHDPQSLHELLRSDAVVVRGFIPLAGPDSERQQPPDAEQATTLSYDADQHIEPRQLVGILDRPGFEAWSGIGTPDDRFPAGSVVEKQHRRLVASHPTP